MHEWRRRRDEERWQKSFNNFFPISCQECHSWTFMSHCMRRTISVSPNSLLCAVKIIYDTLHASIVVSDWSFMTFSQLVFSFFSMLHTPRAAARWWWSFFLCVQVWTFSTECCADDSSLSTFVSVSVFLMTFVHLDFVWHVERLFLVCLLRAVVVESDIPLYFAPASREKSLNVIKILRIRIAREKKSCGREKRAPIRCSWYFFEKRFIRISSTAKCGILHSASDLTMEWCFHPLWTIWNFCKFCPITPPQSCEKLHIPDLDSTTYFRVLFFFHFALLNIWKLCHSSRESSSAGSVAMSEKILEISRLLILRWEFNWSWWMQQIEWHDNGRTATVCAF